MKLIVFLQPVVGHPRYTKRVIELSYLGYHYKVLSFRRKQLSEYNTPYSYIDLGKIQHGKYFSRLSRLLVSVKTIKRYLQNCDIIYVFGLDLLLLVKLILFTRIRKPKVVYEVGDIRRIAIEDTVKSKIIRLLEKYLIESVNVLVATSRMYISEYYKRKLNINKLKYTVIENKLPSNYSGVYEISNKKSNNITIGYFGIIRCQRSWDILEMLSKMKDNKFRVIIRGIIRRIGYNKNEILKNPNFTYYGEYLYPIDLNGMYNQVDMVWVAGPYGELDWKMVRANRFYEACFYKRPLIALAGSQDGFLVNKFDIGININPGNLSDCLRKLNAISYKDMNKWKNNLLQLPKEVYQYTDEHKSLIEKLK